MIIDGKLIDENEALERLREYYRLDAEVDRLMKLSKETSDALVAARSERDRVRRGLVGI